MSHGIPTSTEKRELIVLFGPALAILFTQYIWKMLYISGYIPGIYWGFVFLDKFFVPIALGSLIISIMLLIYWAATGKNHPRHFLLSVSLLLVFVATALTCPMTFAQNTVHLQSVRAEGKVFHLSAAPMFDINYNLSKCDFLGIWCITIYHSGDITSPEWAKLAYNQQTRILTVVDPEKGKIFSYQVSKFLSLEFDKEISP